MSTVPMKHHYVPQSVFRHFSIGGERRSVFVFDKTSQQSFPSPISDAGAERNFYRVKLDGKVVNFEPFFDNLDHRLATLVAKIASSSSLAALSSAERYDLAVVTACQLLRTKLQRTSPIEVSRQLAQRLQDEGMEAPAELTESDSRFISFWRLLELETLADLLASKDLLLIISQEAKLWTSDNPVVLHNTFPYGRPALAAPGVEIYHPLAAHLCLSFLCPSIKEMLTESFDPLHPRPTSKDTLSLQIMRSLQDDTPLEVSANYQLFLNSLQIGHSSRFLFSSEDDFNLVRQATQKHPDLREIRSLISVAHMSSPPPLIPIMPLGTWLVVESGHRHHMLPVELLDESSWTIDFTTSDLVKFAMVEKNAPFDCVTLFKDGQQVRMIREVMFSHIERPGHRFVRVQHLDTSLNTLMEQINQK